MFVRVWLVCSCVRVCLCEHTHARVCTLVRRSGTEEEEGEQEGGGEEEEDEEEEEEEGPFKAKAMNEVDAGRGCVRTTPAPF